MRDGQVLGVIGARDRVRRAAHDVIHDLKHLGLKDLAILTGDRAAPARAVAKKVHIKQVEFELTPAAKAEWIEQRRHDGRVVAMVGDGINDAPALARADVGLAFAGVGGDLAAEAGSVVLLGDPLPALPETIRLARQTVRIIRQNILFFAFGFNAIAVALAGLRVMGPVAAAIVHQIGSLLVLLNAIRLLGFERWHTYGFVRAGEQVVVGMPAVPAVGRARPRLAAPAVDRSHRHRGGGAGLSRVRDHGDRAGPGGFTEAVRPVPAAPLRSRPARPLASALRERDRGRARSVATGSDRPAGSTVGRGETRGVECHAWRQARRVGPLFHGR